MPDTIVPPSREDLKAALRALATDHPDALEQLAARWPAGLPTLKGDHQHTIAERGQIAELLADVIPEPFPDAEPAPAEASTPSAEEKKVAPNRPGPRAAAIASLDDVRTRGKALPADLFASLEEQVPNRPPGEGGVANITVDEVNAAVKVLEATEEVAATRLRRVHAALGTAGLDDDDHRHAIIHQLTNGRTQSSKELTGVEVDHVVDAAQKVETDLATLGYLEDGTPVLLDRDGFPLPVLPALDWRALAKEWGVKLGDLLRQAAELAALYGVDAPKKVDQIEGPVAQRLLARRALEGSTVAAAEQGPRPAPAAAAPQDPSPAAAVASVPSPDPTPDDGADAPSVLVVIQRPGGGFDVITTTPERAAEAAVLLKGAA